MSDLVPLTRYAFVTAALSEGYTLPEALEREGLSEDEWEDAEERWVERLQESAESDLALHDELDRLLAAARAQFSRRVPPLDTDLTAFLAFQRHVVSAPRLLPFLREHGLFLGDWVRLQEIWAERLVADRDARAVAAVALAEGEARALPEIQPDPRVWPAPAEGGRVPLRAIADIGGEAREEAFEWGLAGLRDGGVSEAGSPPTPVAKAGSLVELEPANAASPQDPHPSATAPEHVPSFMRRAVDEAPGAPEGSAVMVTWVGPPEEPPDTADTTLAPQLLPLLAVLPFEGKSADVARAGSAASKPEVPGVSGAALQANRGEQQPPERMLDDGVGATIAPFASLQRPALPFTPEAKSHEAQPSKRALDDDIGATLAPFDSSPRAVLPFMPIPSPGGVLVRPPMMPAPAAPVMPPSPPGQGALAPETRGTAGPAPAGRGMPPGRGAAVDLSLAQYAGLCAELAAFPGAGEEVFARFGLADRRTRLETDFAWRERLRRDPSLYGRWQALYEQRFAQLKK